MSIQNSVFHCCSLFSWVLCTAEIWTGRLDLLGLAPLTNSNRLLISCCMDSIKEQTSLPTPELLTTTSCRKDRKRISAESFLMFPRRPKRSRTELNWTESISASAKNKWSEMWVPVLSGRVTFDSQNGKVNQLFVCVIATTYQVSITLSCRGTKGWS